MIRGVGVQQTVLQPTETQLQRTGKLVLQGGCAEDQLALFTENQGDDNARHHE
jgi:hypothetical protein